MKIKRYHMEDWLNQTAEKEYNLSASGPQDFYFGDFLEIGCRLRFLNLMECENWVLDMDKWEQMVMKKTKLIIINNPHNPIGWTLTEDVLKRTGELARENDCYLFVD